MSLSVRQTGDNISYKVDKKTGKLICLECGKPTTASKVVDGRVVCVSCAKKLKEKKE